MTLKNYPITFSLQKKVKIVEKRTQKLSKTFFCTISKLYSETQNG